MNIPAGESRDIQALFRSGFGPLEDASFLLVRMTGPVEARAWFAAVGQGPGAEQLAYRVTHAGDLDSYQARVLQVAFTAQGLGKLGVTDDVVSAFSREFTVGEVTEEAEREGRLRRLGDVGANAPAGWDWGTRDQFPDALIMLYTEAGGMAGFKQAVIADLAAGFEVLRILDTANVSGDQKPRREPFGFVDGISQPVVDWKATGERADGANLEYLNAIAVGEFLLGYVNEYGFYTQRPLLDPERDPENLLPAADEIPAKRDLGRNGTYLVLRQLEQDVAQFWRFAAAQSPGDGGVSVAEAMLGRRLSTGDALVAASRATISGVGPEAEDIRQNGFTFDADPDGLSCPHGAHVRRANPRTGDLPGGRQGLIPRLLHTLGLSYGGPREDVISSSRFHRIIRRGRPYGAAAEPEGLRDTYPGSKIGLFFVALNANISRQFEFIQSAWIVNSKFDGLDGESDPLLGTRMPSPLGQPTDGFTVPQASGTNRRFTGLPQFVTVRGSAYLFLPGLRALRFIARQGEKSSAAAPPASPKRA